MNVGRKIKVSEPDSTTNDVLPFDWPVLYMSSYMASFRPVRFRHLQLRPMERVYCEKYQKRRKDYHHINEWN